MLPFLFLFLNYPSRFWVFRIETSHGVLCFLLFSRRICFCPLGFAPALQNGGAKNEFLDGVLKVEEFVKDPWGIRVRDGKGTTVQVWVPKVVPPPPPVQPVGVVGEALGGADGVDEMAAAMSAQTKRIALQRKAAAAMIAAEDYARRFESGNLVVRVLVWIVIFMILLCIVG